MPRATFERGSGGHVAERVSPVPGSDDEAKYQALADDPSTAWRRVAEPPTAKPPAKRKTTATT